MAPTDESTRAQDVMETASGREPGPGIGESMDELAHRADPSLAAQDRRAKLLAEVRSRRTVRWVPASELLRSLSSRAAGGVIATVDLSPRKAWSAEADRIDTDRRKRLGPNRPLRDPIAGRVRAAAGIVR